MNPKTFAPVTGKPNVADELAPGDPTGAQTALRQSTRGPREKYATPLTVRHDFQIGSAFSRCWGLPLPCHATRICQRPCVTHADRCLQSDGLPYSRRQASQEIGWDAHQAFKASKEFSAARNSTEITAFMEEAFRIQSMMKDAAKN